VVTVNGVVPGEVTVRRGERLRLRLVNAANARLFALVFDGHRPLVVAIDGHPVAPHAPAEGRVVLAPGMRVDLVLDATGEPGRRYAVGDVFYPRAAYDLLNFVYAAAPLRDPFPDAPGALAPNPLPEPDLRNATVHDIRFEGGMMGSLHSATLNGQPMNLRELVGQGKAWSVNGVAAAGHEPPHHGAAGHHHGEPPALDLRLASSYRLRLHNDTRWHHPIHLHGHSFRVLSRNGRPTPHREWQDTVLLSPGERVEIALVADNPGLWMLHCHVLEHQHGGMMASFRVA
jgi:FtsP/CotA-like multicopper oxidase with cupredoxin domain